MDFGAPPDEHPVELMKTFFFFSPSKGILFIILSFFIIEDHCGRLGWCFLYYFLMSPNLGELSPLWFLIFGMGTPGGSTFTGGASRSMAPPPVKGTCVASVGTSRSSMSGDTTEPFRSHVWSKTTVSDTNQRKKNICMAFHPYFGAIFFHRRVFSVVISRISEPIRPYVEHVVGPNEYLE